MKQIKYLIAPFACLGLAGMIGTSVSAQDENFKLEDLTCFDVISQPYEDSLFVIALLIGHASGVTGNTEMSGPMLEEIIENFDLVCGENPNMKAIEVVAR